MGPRFVQTTRERGRGGVAGNDGVEPVLVLVHHPALARTGAALSIGKGLELSRLLPAFGDAGPLDDPYVSRRAIGMARSGDGVELDARDVEVSVGGVAVRGQRRITAEELERGIDIVLGGRVVFMATTDRAIDADDLGMFGTTTAMQQLREELRAAAQGSGPVLVLGETGAGKELVARALHDGSPRAAEPFVAVNVAAIPAQVAAAELFGHERGAFTGAGERRTGYFERAAGGTLFLDEIADLPEAVQPMLLRAIESGEIQPVGGQPRRVDTFVVAATDADLANAATFRAPLYYRLAATTIRVPPLRERRTDIGLLLARFLCEQLSAELADRTVDANPWLPADVVAAITRASWPGNVRQLRAAAQRLASIARAGRTATLADLDIDAEDAPPDQPDDVDASRLVETLRANRFQLNRTAEALGISRTHLDALIARSPQLRKAKDLTRDEIAACAAELDNDVDAMAARLEVSPRGLRLRMRQLDL